MEKTKLYYQVKVLMVNMITRNILMFLLAWKGVKFPKSYNFPSNTNLKRLLFDLLNIKPDCSY